MPPGTVTVPWPFISILVLLLLAPIPIVWATLSALIARYEKSLDQRFSDQTKTLEQNFEQISLRIDDIQASITEKTGQLDLELKDLAKKLQALQQSYYELRLEMANEYVRKTAHDQTLKRIYDSLENLRGWAKGSGRPT